MKSTEIAYIYALLEPITNEVRYIGKTIHPKRRLKDHIRESKNLKNHRGKWIMNLLSSDLEPTFKILKICPLSEFVKYETEYIALYNKYGRLTNSDETGQGNSSRIKDVIDRISETSGKVVYQFDLDGNYISEYRSVRFAATTLGISHSNISRCCNGIFKHSGGFIFSYDRNSILDSVSNPNSIRKSISELDVNGVVINSWTSLMDCCRDTGIDNGNLSKVCNGKSKSIRGRYFIFQK